MFRVAVIGGGVVGCAIARAVTQRLGIANVVVLEQEQGVALHTSGRNSGVVQSGFGLKPGTPQAALGLESARRVRDYCQDRKLPYQQIGMVVVGHDDHDGTRLDELHRRAHANGLDQVRLLDQRELRELEPRVAGTRALYSPYDGILDNRRFVQALAADAKRMGATMQLGRKVQTVLEAADRVRIVTDAGEVEAEYLINCSGINADRIAHLCGVGLEYGNVPFRGDFYECLPHQSQLVRRLVYPLSHPEFPFLGIHMIPTVDGRLLVGPTATLALGRGAYSLRDVRPRELASLVSSKSFRRMVMRPDVARMMVGELRHTFLKRSFVAQARALVPSIATADVRRAHSAIRAVLVDERGHLVEDYQVIRFGSRSCHVLKNPGPGFTAALGFADQLVDRVAEQL